MVSPFLSILMQYAGPVVIGILIGLVCKAIFASRFQNKIQAYQNDILRSHAKILELEAKNDLLEKRLKEIEGAFTKDRIFMN